MKKTSGSAENSHHLVSEWTILSLMYPTRRKILEHRIGISEILPWVRKSYLTHVILPRWSREGYIHWLYWNSSTWLSSDVIAMLM